MQFGQPRPRLHFYSGCNQVYLQYDFLNRLTCREVNYLHAASRDAAALLLCCINEVWVVVNNGGYIIAFWDEVGGLRGAHLF